MSAVSAASASGAVGAVETAGTAGVAARPRAAEVPTGAAGVKGAAGVEGAGDLARIRSDFPALAAAGAASHRRRKPLAYLDNAATTQKPTCVIEALDRVYRAGTANPYRGAYRLSEDVTRLYEGARAVVARFVGADADEIVFTRNATEAINLIAHSFALAPGALGPGDEIVLPISEHHSNLVVWQQVCRRTGARLVYLRPGADGRLSSEELSAKIGPATKIVACAQVSNVLGTVFPVERIIARAHEVGAVVVLDCAQGVAHLPVDARALDADFIAFSGHKMYGPFGIGVLFAARACMDRMDPFLFGGEMIDAVYERVATFESGPKRFEAGTPNVEGAVGLAAAAEYVSQLGFERIRLIERGLAERVLSGLGAIESVRIIGNRTADADRLGVVAFTVEGTEPDDVARVLDDAGVAIRSGTHCAQPLHRALDLEATCRVSPCFYNTPDEIDRFLEAVAGARRAIVSRRVMTMLA